MAVSDEWELSQGEWGAGPALADKGGTVEIIFTPQHPGGTGATFEPVEQVARLRSIRSECS